MDQNKQKEIVVKALGIEENLESLRETIRTIEAETPEPPQLEEIEEESYPRIKTYPYWKMILKFLLIGVAVAAVLYLLGALIDKIETVAMILGGLALIAVVPVSIIYYYVSFKKAKVRYIEKVRTSEKYQAQCQEIEQKNDAKKVEAERRYQEELRNYETRILPEYQKRAADAQSNLVQAEKDAEAFYASEPLIPMMYRNVYSLTDLCDLITNSGHEIKEAINQFEIIENNRMCKDMDDALWNIANEMHEANRISAAARREAAIASAVGVIQRHKSNKYLGSVADYFESKKK